MRLSSLWTGYVRAGHLYSIVDASPDRFFPKKKGKEKRKIPINYSK